MRSRLAVLLLLLATALGAATVVSSPATAAGTALHTSSTRPLLGEAVTLSGTLHQARRSVSLQRLVDGHWTSISTTRTGSRGGYAFHVRTYGTAYSYRVYSGAVRSHPSALSNVVRVTAASSRLTLSVDRAATGQPRSLASRGSGATLYSMAQGQLHPARPGRTVYVYRQSGSSWKYVGRGVQNSYGTYRAPVPNVYTTPSARFRARYAGVTSADVAPIARTLAFYDNFNGTRGSRVDHGKWAPRLQGPGGRRTCSSVVNDRLVSVTGSGLARLGIYRRPGTASSACRYGRFYNSMISTEGTGLTLAPYGVFAARVKFPHHQGMHGAFWLQGTASDSVEMDVAEYFGDGRSDGGLASFVHRPDGNHKAGGIRSYRAILGAGRRPSDGFHVYSVQWTPTTYVFRIDGVPTLTYRPTGGTADTQESIMLSLLSSDYEIPYLTRAARAQGMYVDWVRAWQ